MSRFEVGEVVIIARSVLPEYPVGMEVTVLQIIEHQEQGTVYVIDRPGLFVFITADEGSLRKRNLPPRREPLGKWTDCPWQPGREVVYDMSIDARFIKELSYTTERFVGA